MYDSLPDDLPAPADDGAADHLVGTMVPELALPTTANDMVTLAQMSGRTILYIYPKTGRPDVPMPHGWEEIPGARGCTPESCAFRDHHADITKHGARVFGLSSQTTEYQSEMVERLHLPFPIISDPSFALGGSLHLPTFEAFGEQLYSRITLAILDGLIEHVWYPIFPTDTHAAAVLSWLDGRAVGATTSSN